MGKAEWKEAKQMGNVKENRKKGRNEGDWETEKMTLLI
jgi:hypothetical protein